MGLGAKPVQCPLPKSAKAAGKRKHREKDEDEWTGVKEVIKEHLHTPGSSIAKSNPPGFSALLPLTTSLICRRVRPLPVGLSRRPTRMMYRLSAVCGGSWGDFIGPVEVLMETTEKLAKENVMLMRAHRDVLDI